MKILGIDYGKSKVGLAIAEDKISFPLGVIKFKTEDILFEKILDVIKKESVERVVLGVSEGKMKEETLAFAQKLEKILEVPIDLQDETLTSKEAQSLSIEAGIKRKKRKALEDAYAAALILDDYLEKMGNTNG